MKCPECYSATRIIDSRYTKTNNTTRRRHECIECSFRFSTIEKIKAFEITEEEKQKAFNDFSRMKL